MKKCLDLAIMGLKKTKSNPLVGCVITYNGVIVSTGYHKKFGGPHAELDAIQKLKKKILMIIKNYLKTLTYM